MIIYIIMSDTEEQSTSQQERINFIKKEFIEVMIVMQEEMSRCIVSKDYMLDTSTSKENFMFNFREHIRGSMLCMQTFFGLPIYDRWKTWSRDGEIKSDIMEKDE